MKDIKKTKRPIVKKKRAKEQVRYGDDSAKKKICCRCSDLPTERQGCEVCLIAMNYLRGRIEHIDEYEA